MPFNTEGYKRAKNILVTKFSKQSEVVNEHIQSVMNLPTIQNYQLEKIHEFYDKPTSHIQVLQTLGKLNETNGSVRNKLNTLAVIRADLVRTHDEWQEWDISRFVETLHKWMERNTVDLSKKAPPIPLKRENYYKQFRTRNYLKFVFTVTVNVIGHQIARK